MRSREVGVAIVVIVLQLKSFLHASAKSLKYTPECAHLALGTCANFCSELQERLNGSTFGGTPEKMYNVVNNVSTGWDNRTS